MKSVTWKEIEALKPCADALNWGREAFKGVKSIVKVELIQEMIKYEKLDWANWLIVPLMEKLQYVDYAIFATEQVIDIYEKKHLKDDIRRKAIEASKEYLKKPLYKNINDDSAFNACYAVYNAFVALAIYDARKKMKIKILNYGIKLLKEKG